ncbi:adenylate/guanylate cyclase with Chase sensor [Sulfuricurvum kujiense DSM 16994]|uniref:Adenylate/guanylate cyclase with Chase sensor n=2 Tax=Sulfuricurvum kujiense TaxID=148813 RepID=E4U2Y9_SULKY|nr:adenylate/guanylate cyclase with Chase sensor [Sulfuricurvum kujiense DSM 16994]
MTLGIAAVALVGYLKYPSVFMPFEHKINDAMFLLRGEIQGDQNIVIVDIDEKSLKELGQWPWSRDKVAHLLENLKGYGAAIIGIDVVFAEPDNSSPKAVFRKLGIADTNVADYDRMLGETIAQTPAIVGYVFALSNDGVAPENTPTTNAVIIEKNKPASSFLIKPYRAVLNIPLIQDNAYSSGYFNTLPDKDGVVRSVPLVMEYGGIIYPSLSLEMIRIMLNERKITLEYDDRGVNRIMVGDRVIPTDFYARMMVNYRGSAKSYRYISAADVYNKKIDPSLIEGKIVLLGTSAAGLLDLRSTPFDSAYPGVEVHANVMDNIINQTFIAQPIWAVGVDIVTILVVPFLIFAILLLPGAMASFAAFIALNAGIIGGHYYLMMREGIVLNTLIPLLAMIALFLAGQVINYFLENKQKEMIKGKFARKVSPAVMNDILSSTTEDILAGTEREITIFFSDMRNFTNISEVLGNPKGLIRFMNAYMEPMTEIIIKSGGTVDKFIGDAIMAYWNAPLAIENHADKAVGAALEQLHGLDKLNSALKKNPDFAKVAEMSDKKGLPIVDIGIGVNTGTAIVGEMGTRGRSDYTVIGDTINLGSRLESLCKYYNSRLNISGFTKQALKGEYIFRFLDLVTVKGKSEPVEIWQIHDFDRRMKHTLYPVSKEELDQELKRYHEAIELYKTGLFAEALALFKEVESWENKTNRSIYKIYIDRCEHYIQNPPESFNGVFVHTTKG